MKRVLYLIASGMLIASVVGVVPASAQSLAAAQAQGQSGSTSATNFPIQGTGTTAAGVPADFTGHFLISKFEVVNGRLVAVGRLTAQSPRRGSKRRCPSRT